MNESVLESALFVAAVLALVMGFCAIYTAIRNSTLEEEKRYAGEVVEAYRTDMIVREAEITRLATENAELRQAALKPHDDFDGELARAKLAADVAQRGRDGAVEFLREINQRIGLWLCRPASHRNDPITTEGTGNGADTDTAAG